MCVSFSNVHFSNSRLGLGGYDARQADQVVGKRENLGVRVNGLGCIVQVHGFGVWRLLSLQGRPSCWKTRGFGFQGLRSRVYCSGFRVEILFP